MNRTLFVLLAVAVVSILQSCQKEEEFSSPLSSASNESSNLKKRNLNTFYGPTVPLGGGVARAWVTENLDGEPVAVGVNLSEKALDNLPSEPAAIVLMLPKSKGMNFYKHVLLDWNPQGHEPEHIYDRPHFDVHFYTISNETRMGIGPLAPPDYDLAPDPDFVPPAYLQLPGIVPEMGAHWADLLAPEFQPGGVFTKTFIWGSFHGNFVFWEPMITREFLLTHPDVTTPIRQPLKYQQNGWYAQSYRVAWSDNPGEYTIALTDLEYRESIME